MARKKSFQQQMESINKEIQMCETKLNRLYQEREEILKQKQQAELASLYHLIQNHGMTIEDVTCMIEKSNQNPA